MTVFISGVSKGLGKSLAIAYLNLGCKVVGIGRSHSILHPNFRFIEVDLRNVSTLEAIDFQTDDEVILINNAGVIGHIKRLSDQKQFDIEEVITVNTIAPMVLTATLLKQTHLNQKVTVLNISSGAASRAIPGWASYCASKAALDRFSETLYTEEKEKGRAIRVFSMAPGVIDTEMQSTIRASQAEDFSSLETFKGLKWNNELQSAEETAVNLIDFLNRYNNDFVVGSLKILKQEL
jgi:benzil reductase ((S)-benzoin forming)